MSDSKLIKDLQKKLSDMEKRLTQLESVVQKSSKPKVKREPSAYNKFMSSQSSVVKKEHPDWTQPQVMKEVARMWKEQKE